MISAVHLLSRRLGLTQADRETLLAILRLSGGSDEAHISLASLAVVLGLTTLDRVYRLREPYRRRVIDCVGKRVARLCQRLCYRNGTPILGYTAGYRKGNLRVVSAFHLAAVWRLLEELASLVHPGMAEEIWKAHDIGERKPVKKRSVRPVWERLEPALRMMEKISEDDCCGGGAQAVRALRRQAERAAERLDRVTRILRSAEAVLQPDDGPSSYRLLVKRARPKTFFERRIPLSTEKCKESMGGTLELGISVYQEYTHFVKALHTIGAWNLLCGLWTQTKAFDGVQEKKLYKGSFTAATPSDLWRALVRGAHEGWNVIVTVRAQGFVQVDDITDIEKARKAGACMILHTGGSAQAWFWISEPRVANYEALARALGGNLLPCNSCRVPGSINHKHGKLVRCELVTPCEQWKPRPIKEILRGLVSTEDLEHVTSDRALSPGQKLHWKHICARVPWRYPFYDATRVHGYYTGAIAEMEDQRSRISRYDIFICQVALRAGWTHQPRALATWLSRQSPVYLGDEAGALAAVLIAGERLGVCSSSAKGGAHA